MTSLAYTVALRFDSKDVADAYIAWLTHGHMEEVVGFGAERATLVQFDATSIEVRYRFADQAAFDAYFNGPGVALRAEAAKRFPPSSGIHATRTTGSVIASFRAKS